MHKALIIKLVVSAIVASQHASPLVEAAAGKPRRPRTTDLRRRVDLAGNTCVDQNHEQGLGDDVVISSARMHCGDQRASLLQRGSRTHMLPFDSGEDISLPQASGAMLTRVTEPAMHPAADSKVMVREELAAASADSASQALQSSGESEAGRPGQTLGARQDNRESSAIVENPRDLPLQQHNSSENFGYPRGTMAAIMLVTEIAYTGARRGVQHTPGLTITILVIVGAALIFISIVKLLRGDEDKHITDAVSALRRSRIPPVRRTIQRADVPSHPVTPRTSYISSAAPSMRQLGPSYTSQPILQPSSRRSPRTSPRLISAPVESITRQTSPQPVPRLVTTQQPREVLPLVASRHLCPGLVVPTGNECILAVPTLRHVGVPPHQTAAFNIQDLDGKSVIQAEVVAPAWNKAGGVDQRPMLVLRAGLVPGGGGRAAPLLAFCKAGQEAGDRRNVYIYDARDELFAHICKDRNYSTRYVLTSGRIGLQLIFEGDFANRRVRVTNEQQQLLSETETCRMSFDPSGSYYKLRVVADVDVGLMLCALIAIDHMELP